MNRWVAKHRWTAMFLYYALIWLPVLLFHIALHARISPWWAAYGFFMFYFSYLWSGSAIIVLFNKANKALNDECDPYPLEKEINDQLSYVKSKPCRVSLAINMAAVLHAMGRYEESANLLEETDIDNCRSLTPAFKFLYYNNLFCAYCNTGRTQELAFLLQKAQQILANLKAKEKIKKSLQETLQINFAEIHIIKREYELAEALLEAVDSENACMRQKAGIHLSKAQILIETDRPQEARQHLDFVLEHGNKLYIVERAKEYLEKL